MREMLLPPNGLLFKLKFDKLLGRFRTQNVSTYTKYTVETQQPSTECLAEELDGLKTIITYNNG